ncbi:probable carbohydrate esterase at4g34215, partial [Phtheirospermum japonicum]
GVIGLVPCAAGGTSTSKWQRGQFLYNQLVERSNAALQDGGCIRAMLWYQGERDANDTSSAGSYGARLRQFFSDIRLDLGSTLLPIVQVALATTAGRYVDTVRRVPFEIDLLNVVCVDTYDLEVKNNDRIHLSTSAQVQLDGMFADAVLFSTLDVCFI